MYDDTRPRRRLTDILVNGQYANLRDSWDHTEAAADFAPLPGGTYECHVHSVELFNARTGTPGVKVRFVVLVGEHAGRALFHDCWLTPAALPQTKRDLAKLGISTLEQLESAVVPSGRIRCKVRVALRRDDAGVERNRVTRFDVLRVDEPERDPFAPIDDAAAQAAEAGAPKGGEHVPF
ncbi:MAG: DUF669 domain-containing protein [Phycisphaerae bacterium]|nr:DUF669 domain-containing protein [Phycisphaerae bacterium]